MVESSERSLEFWLFEVTKPRHQIEQIHYQHRMPLPGQNFCPKCMKPVAFPGPCDSCQAKEQKIIKMGNYCDHCGTNASNSMLYLNKNTKKRYCVDCRATFHKHLMMQGFEPETANKILIQDFVLVNDPLKNKRKSRKK